jgi:YHS domain-containing protein
MLRLFFPYLLFAAIVLFVALDHLSPGDEVATQHAGMVAVSDEGSRVGRDLVCGMDVGDDITAVHEGERYFFCHEMCREAFLAEPDVYVRENCPVCLADSGLRTEVAAEAPEFTWQGRAWRFCSIEHRDAFGADPAGYFVHSMWGIPPWLYAISVALVLVLSFGLFEIVARAARKRPDLRPRFALFRLPGLEALVRWPRFRTLCQLLVVGVFALIVTAGLYGDQLASRNIAPLLTWTVWWGGLVLLILFAGKAWCYVCPWDAIAGWAERLVFWRKRQGLGLGVAWPKRLRNVWLATGFFVGLTWLELGFGVTMNPRATALIALGMVSLALVCALVFERRAFCRYACLVGRVSGLYALFAASEVRPADRDLCRGCATKDCYHGNERGDACPTGLFPGALKENTYCINCLECVKTCPADNMVVNARPWGADLAVEGHARKDEAYLALLMLSITGFHGLTMTGSWRDLLGWIEGFTGLPYLLSFSIGMSMLMLGPVAIYALLVKLTTLVARSREVSFGTAFVRFAYSVLPIALFYHLAHNLEHLLMEGQKTIALASNPFGFAPGERWSVLGLEGTGEWNLLGTAGWTVPPLTSLPTLWLVQVLLVLVGHLYSLWIADRTARRLYPGKGAAFRSQVPMLVGMVLFSIFSLWLLKQPMEMRTSAM